MPMVKKTPKEAQQQVDEQAHNDIPEERHDLKILQALRRIIRSVDLHSRKLSMQHNITAPQLVTLLAIADHGPVTIAGLSSEIHLSPSTLVGIIDRLENKGLVERKRDTQDRRRVFIQITKHGKKFSSSAPSPLQERLAQSLEALTPLERSTIALSLERVVEFMEAEDLDAAPMLETGFIDES